MRLLAEVTPCLSHLRESQVPAGLGSLRNGPWAVLHLPGKDRLLSQT